MAAAQVAAYVRLYGGHPGPAEAGRPSHTTLADHD